MVIVQVVYHIKEAYLAEFRAALIENAQATATEPGNLRFETYQDAEDLHKFILFEIFASDTARQAHFEAPHFLKFRQTVADMVMERRVQTLAAVHPTTFAK